ncbi:MAG: DUF4402 domain-containing protein [Parasphingorhabdus sp.]|uniref:DUF4402 domain-containing protein n=1 Tax=Parasphingorhabdus sp. TaxID=2709688 RepID=UPI0030012AFB
MMTRDQMIPRLIGCLLALLIGMTSAPAVFAQTATANGRAVTIGPLSVVNTALLEFGNIIPSATPGSVTIDTRNGNRTRTGGVTLASGGAGRGTFIIYGGPNQIVEISIPGTMTVRHTNGTHTMNIDRMAIGNGNRNFNTFVRGFLGTLGIYQLTVGGRLNVNGNQQAGQYSGTFTMTVDYL